MARTDPNTLMQDIGKDLYPVIKAQGQAALREIIATATRNDVPVANLPYVIWSLATSQSLPDLGPRRKVFQAMLSSMSRTGVLPNYHQTFEVPVDPEVDAAVDRVAEHMSVWAARSMLPALMAGYVRILNRHASRVPDATGGTVPTEMGVAYLNEAFREVLTLRSSMFADGELLRRVVRIIPEW